MKHNIGTICFIHDRRWWNLISTVVMITSADQLKPHKHKIPYHCYIVVDKYNMVESCWGPGVRKIPIDYYERKKKIIVWYKCLKEEYWKDKIVDRAKLQDWLLTQVGQPYDRLGLIPIAIRSLVRIVPPFYRFLKKRTSWLDSRFKFHCSELVMRAYLECMDLNIYPKASTATCTPHDLNRSDKLELTK